MVYFGQELGEPAADSEGFSGADGRTTIFDYWTVPTISRWRNGGKFDGRRMREDEKELQAFYRTVLTLCNKEKALREGEFFDIMYANYDNAMMNTHRQYAFLRKSGKDLILVVANFDERGAHTSIKIPAHAFDYLKMPQSANARPAVDLLTGEKENITLNENTTIDITIPALNGKVIKIRL
jgi:hypothetical protein